MGSLEQNPSYRLTEAQKSHFLKHGFIKIPSCFTPSQASSFASTMWTRLGMSPTDKSTWTEERVHMPWHMHIPVSEFAPKAWSAMCQLLGGEERISQKKSFRGWSDGFIVNLGKEEFEGLEKEEQDLRDLDGWHVDGDFFVHYLDSPEQALLVIPLFSDIKPKGGGTVIATDGIKWMAKHLYEHPEGVTPWMRSLSDTPNTTYEGRSFWKSLASDTTKISSPSIIEVTGEIGDVYLLHPLMLHSASKNILRIPRVITNPPVSLEHPFNFDREDPSEYSLVELKTLKDLGMEGGLKWWKIEGERKGWVSQRIKRMEEIKRKELERLGSEG